MTPGPTASLRTKPSTHLSYEYWGLNYFQVRSRTGYDLFLSITVHRFFSLCSVFSQSSHFVMLMVPVAALSFFWLTVFNSWARNPECIQKDCMGSELSAQSCPAWPCNICFGFWDGSGEGTCHSWNLISHKTKVGFLSLRPSIRVTWSLWEWYACAIFLKLHYIIKYC